MNPFERAGSGKRPSTSERLAEASGEESPELVSKPLGRFRPKRPMTGRRIGILALAVDALWLVLHKTVVPIPAIVLAATGIYTGKRDLGSKGRGFATIVLFLFHPVIVGEEGFTRSPSSTSLGQHPRRSARCRGTNGLAGSPPRLHKYDTKRR